MLPTVQWIPPGVSEGLPAQVNDLCPPKPEAKGVRALSVPRAGGWMHGRPPLVAEAPGSVKCKAKCKWSGDSVGRKTPAPTPNRIGISNTQA